MMPVIKVLTLPSKPNRALINVLALGFITEEFQHLSNSIARSLGNNLARDNEAFNQVVLKTINAVLLDNVMSYITSTEKYHFATVIGYNQFIANCQVRVKYLDEFFDKWSAIREDKEETEGWITYAMLSWLGTHYQSYPNDFNTCFLELYEAMMIYTPHRYVRTYRFETDPDLRPLLIYSDCLDKVHEAIAVQ